MSFVSVLKKIGTVALGVERAALPVVSILAPAAAPVIGIADGLITRLQTAITTVEANDPRDGQGKVKAAAVIEDFRAGMALTQEILAAAGQKLTYDEGKLQECIDAQVKALNLMAELKSTFKVVKL